MSTLRWLLMLSWCCATAVPLAGRGIVGRETAGRGTAGCGTEGRGASGRGTSGRGTSGRGVRGHGVQRRDASDNGQIAARRAGAIRRACLRAKRLRCESSDGSADGESARAAWADRQDSGDHDAEPRVCGWARLAGLPDPDGEAGEEGRSGPSAPRAFERSSRQRRGEPKSQQRAQGGDVPNATDAGQPKREESRYMTADIKRALKRRRRHYSTGSMMLHQSLAKASNVFNLLAILSGQSHSLRAACGAAVAGLRVPCQCCSLSPARHCVPCL